MTARRQGIKKLLASGAGLFLVWLYARFFNSTSDTVSSFSSIGAATIAAYGLAGTIEIISGVPFTALASKWDSLKGWQRGILGTLIAIFAFIVFVFVLSSLPIW